MPHPYERKELRYEICKFLIDKKREQDSIGKPLIIGLKEMSGLLDFGVSRGEDDKISDLAHELATLNDERFDDDLKRRPLEIKNIEILEEFISNYKANMDLDVRCLSKNLEDYLVVLKEATTRSMVAQCSKRIENIQNGGVRIVTGNLSMKVLGGKGARLHTNIVRLMFGAALDSSATMRRQKATSVRGIQSDYQIGDAVPFSGVADILNVFDEGGSIPATERNVKDAVKNINQRAVKDECLGEKLFTVNTDGSFFLKP